MLYIHIMEYYSAFKRKEILSHATAWKDLEDMAEWNKPVTKTQEDPMVPATSEWVDMMNTTTRASPLKLSKHNPSFSLFLSCWSMQQIQRRIASPRTTKWEKSDSWVSMCKAASQISEYILTKWRRGGGGAYGGLIPLLPPRCPWSSQTSCAHSNLDQGRLLQETQL